MAFWNTAKWALIYLFLFVCSIQDIREKKLSVKMLSGFGILFFILSLVFEDAMLEERIFNMMPGALILLTAFLTKEQIGYGDGIFLLVLGNIAACDILMRAATAGLFLLSVFSFALLARKRADRKTTLPFLPFFMAGMALQSIIFIR